MALKINGLFLKEMKPDLVLAGCIEVFENVWPNWKETIQLTEQECANTESGAYWEKAGTIGQGQFQDHRTNKLMQITQIAEVSNNHSIQQINNQFYTLLLAASNSYVNRFGIKEPLWHEGYCLLKYSNNQEYKAHYDGGTDIGRAISAICYLNDDYEGGEIEFVNYGVKIKPPAGSLVLFPSNYAFMHIAHPVTSGTKYALVTWIRDRQI
jgi:predicted 2-oxoglutarate/Fe(II)-dependent dioxygenase YbiX